MGLLSIIRRLGAPPAVGNETWDAALAALPILDRLSLAELERLRRLSARFLADKRLEPALGLVLDETMRVIIAAQACLAVLNLGLGSYRGWRSVIVYPGEFKVRGHDVDEAGVVHEFEDVRAGESWHSGPAVLSWADVEVSGQCDGYNVVIHEMAHKLDMLDGADNGRPPLHWGMDSARWSRVFGEAYRDLENRVTDARPTPVDPYAAESPAEFFAVLSEYFFELPQVVSYAYPDVFELLKAFYRQNPKDPKDPSENIS